MNKLIISFIFVLSTLFLFSCKDDNSEWAVYTSAEGGFSIKMPANPKKTEKKEVTAFGKQVTHFITWKPSNLTIDKFKLFEVSYTDVPARFTKDSATLQLMLDSSINMRKKDFTELDINAESINFNGYPGRAFIYYSESATSIATVKQCIVNNKRYDVTVVTKKNYNTNNEIGNFFNSFQVLRR